MWLNYDSNLRKNVRDTKIKELLKDAIFKGAVPTPAGLQMSYILKDGKDAQVLAKFSPKGQIISSKL